MAQSALSADPRGLKRICLSCSTRFYDMNKRPIECPNCGTEFTGEIKIKTRRGRLSAGDIIEGGVGPDTEAEDTKDENEEEDEETVSLDEVEAEEAGDDADDDAVEIDDADDLDADDLDDDDDDDLDEDLDVDVDEEK